MPHDEAHPALTWTVYLDDVIRQMSAAQKQQLYAAVGVSRTSLQRWRSGAHLPDAVHIQPLLLALDPDVRARLLGLMLEDPKMRVLLPTEIMHPHVPSLADGIAPAFYAEFLRLLREMPDPFWRLCGELFQHALSQLETLPQPVGLQFTVTRCLPAHSNGVVRSLRSLVAMGTTPWRGDLHQQDGFFGIESLAGEAVMSRHGAMVPHLQTTPHTSQSASPVRSAAAYPLLRKGAIGGALLVECHAPDFFTTERLTRIEQYADLLCLAFDDIDFVPPTQVALAVLPAYEHQQPILATFRSRVEDTYRRAQADDGTAQSLKQVEQRVWQEMERELLLLVAHSVRDSIPSSF